MWVRIRRAPLAPSIISVRVVTAHLRYPPPVVVSGVPQRRWVRAVSAPSVTSIPARFALQSSFLRENPSKYNDSKFEKWVRAIRAPTEAVNLIIVVIVTR